MKIWLYCVRIQCILLTIHLCYRHLYIPIVEMGYGKTTASVTVFFISAFFHEYLVSVPLKTFKIWAFMGMMGQVRASRVRFAYIDCANIDSIVKRFLLISQRLYGFRWFNNNSGLLQITVDIEIKNSIKLRIH